MKKISPFILLLTFLFFFGCAHVVSKEARDLAIKEPDESILKNPENYKGKIVILGGIIASSINTEEGTFIEVVQKPLDSQGRPKDIDISYGRFIILYEGYLDTAIYSTGREVTVVGEVIGKKVRQLGQIMYPYLFLKSKELYLFEPKAPLPIRIGIGIWKTF